MLNNFSDRLSYALEQTGISQAELARRINVKRQAIQYLCKSGTDKSKFTFDIATALDIDVNWLLNGEGSMHTQLPGHRKALTEQIAIPILQWEQISAWLEGKLPDTILTEWTTIHHTFSPRCFALALKDNAMYPRFDQGTIVIIDPEVSTTHNCFALVQVERIREVVFRQWVQEGSDIVLHAYNDTAYKQILLSNEDQCLGCLVEAKWLYHTDFT